MADTNAHESLPQRSRARKERHRQRTAGDGGDGDATPSAPVITMRARGAGAQYEFLDHTADVQIHSWGATLEEVMEWQVLGMFNYMTDTATVDPKQRIDVEVTDAHDIRSLLYKLMDEFLFHFSAEFFTLHEVRITHLDMDAWRLKASAWGEPWDPTKHTIGTEVKAITFMQLRVTPPGGDDVDVVLEDAAQSAPISAAAPSDFYNAYVVIDI